MPSWKNWPASKSPAFQSLDLRAESGQKPDLSPEMDGALRGEPLMLNFGECPNEERESRLSWILEDNVPEKYYLSIRAREGILNRASRRGKALPEILHTALLDMIEWCAGAGAYTLKIRSGCEGGGKGPLVQTEKSATLSTLQDQTLFVMQGNVIDRDIKQNGGGIVESETMFTLNATDRHGICCAGFTAGQGAKANGIGWAEEQAPTLRTDGGLSAMPTVLCRAHGQANAETLEECSPSFTCNHEQPIVFESHSQDARYTQQGDTSPACTARKILLWTVRRLTPTECERLQGFPDGWTDIGEWVDRKGKRRKPADSPRYKALGNSIALPQWWWITCKMARYLPEHATLGSLFDGIGGFPLVWETRHGKSTAVWASEIEEFPIAVTKKRFPG